MDTEGLQSVIFFMFLLGAGVGFFIAKILL